MIQQWLIWLVICLLINWASFHNNRHNLLQMYGVFKLMYTQSWYVDIEFCGETQNQVALVDKLMLVQHFKF